MDYLRLILKNAARNHRRTLLTILSVGVSLFLLVSLRTLLGELEGSSVLTHEADLRLVTRHAVSLDVPLPLSYLPRLQRIPGVEMAAPFQWFGGYYQDPKNFFAQLAGDATLLAPMASEYSFHPDEVQAFIHDRTGVLVAKKLLDRFGWKVGQRITIIGGIFPFNLELTIRGTYTGPDEGGMWFHYEYFNELIKKNLPRRGDQVGSFWLKVRSAEDVPRVAAAIDAMFRNSEAPTKTETERAFSLSFTSMLGNIRIFISLIAAAVVFAVLLVSMNTMAMSVRERSGEIAVLKTLGFRRGRILALLIGESVLISLIGGVLGTVGARLVFGNMDLYTMTSGIIQHFDVHASTIALGLCLAVLVGIISAAVPAWRATRESITAALRYVG